MGQQLRFEPFTTVVSPAFWTRLAQRKLLELKLDTTPLNIFGFYSPAGRVGGAPTSARFFISEECLEGPESSVLSAR